MHFDMEFKNKILVISCFVLFTTVLGCFLAFRPILEFVVKDQTALRDRNFVKKIYLKIPFPLDFCVYFFNVSNPMAVQDGDIPKLKEIGPYCYDAFKEKIDTEENEGEDSLTYTPYETYFFNATKSGKLSDEDYITVIHPLLLGIVNKVAQTAPPLLTIVNKAIRSIFKNPQTIYLTVKVKDFLFDGMEIDCSGKDFPAQAVCTQLKEEVPGLKEIREDIYSFSIFGPRNGTLPNRIKVMRGHEKSEELGRVIEINHEKSLDVWETEKCNRFIGGDGWIFPPFIDRNNGVFVFNTDLCKNIHLDFSGEIEYRGMNVEKYYADIGDMTENDTKEECYCLNSCLPRGVLDLSKCMGLPILATLPHFVRSDTSLLSKVEGLNPSLDRHIIRINMEPLLGVPLEAQKRMQINILMKPSAKIDLLKNVSEAIHPIFWLEESMRLEGSLLSFVKSVFTFLKIFYYVKFALLGLGLIGIIWGTYLHFQDRKKPTITPIHEPIRKVYVRENIEKY